MPNHRVLELSSLPSRHPPIGEALLHDFGPPTIIRLAHDPTPQPSDTMVRRVETDWIAKQGTGGSVQTHRDIGWAALPPSWASLMAQLPVTVNAQTLTERAAIGVMALLISELEGGILQTVLPIGSGGDYLVSLRKGKGPTQVEVSGIQMDPTGAASRARLGRKTEQVLKKSRDGYASVTTFLRAPGTTVLSYLHYVRKLPKRPGGKKGKKK